MSDFDKTLFILEKISNDVEKVGDNLKEHIKSDDEQFQKISTHLTEQTQILGRMEVDLREHKEGVIQNREVLSRHSKKIEQLENPKKAKEYIKSYIIDVSKIGGAILTLAAIWKLFFT